MVDGGGIFLLASGSGQPPPSQAFPNGLRRAVAAALLIWDKGGEFKDTGHVAIITQLHGNKVRIAEQNAIHSLLPQGQQCGRVSWRWWSKTAAIP
ncbi:CHAP domain-containing protein [Shigella flexneri]